MGTGIVSVLLYSIPFQAHWLRILSSIVFVANIALFALVFGASALRYALYPCTWTLMVHHPVQSLFLGTAPMGFATLINSFVALCIQHGQWGPWAQTFAWTMWWIDVAASVATCIGMPFMIMSAHKTSLQTLTAAWLLPIVAPIVASASGAVVASELTDPQHALWTIVVSYVLWGVGVPLAMVILVMYFHRLAMHKLPPREVIVSVFLPLGPLGQGGFGIQKLGAEAMRVFPRTGTLHPLAGDVLYVAGLGVALVLWGFGLVWLFFAVGSISGSKFPFNMGWWGFTFPLGVYALSTITIGEELPSLFFRVLGTVFAVCVILLWMVVVAGTAKRLPSGRMFDAPCLRTAGEPTAKELAIMKRDEENQQSEDQTCGFAQP
ncbi:voltage-dependent anion channel [Lineolata rhizophorae]|uniref:Sulfite efflux pump SSU1 n=1 Tax=Lineolata rhizophorae TaxID=578093 RepID=A0A6A6NQ10_9PEZI|nr:voltage-dependent anion channel [Lineolata rhizophorae]